jgi:hypothetical protein
MPVLWRNFSLRDLSFNLDWSSELFYFSVLRHLCFFFRFPARFALGLTFSSFVFSPLCLVLGWTPRKNGWMGEDGWWWWRERERSVLTQSKHMRAPSLGGVCSCVHLVTCYADQWQSSNGVVLFRFDASLISRVVVAVAIRFLIHSRK